MDATSFRLEPPYRQLGLVAAFGAGLACLHPAGAVAHPHVFVDAREEVLFDTDGRITAVRNIWQFDEAFSQFAIEGSDANGDGALSNEELQPLAKVNVDSLEEFAFFTYLNAGDVDAVFVPPTDYGLEFDGSRLTLTYTLPTAEPVDVGTKAFLEIFDPGYFVAFEFAEQDPAGLVGAPAGCDASHHRPKEIDARTMDLLNQIPPDQPVPPDLIEAARALANYIAVECPPAQTASLGSERAAPTDAPVDAIDAVNQMAEAGGELERSPRASTSIGTPATVMLLLLLIAGGIGVAVAIRSIRSRKRGH